MQWWVVPEGSLGKLTNALVTSPTLNVYTVKQSATQPPGAVAGPFPTQQQAQAQATTFNQSGANQATLPNVATGAAQASASAISSSVLGPLFQSNIWLRVAEVLAGLILLGIGLNAMLKGRPLAAVTGAAGTVAKVVP